MRRKDRKTLVLAIRAPAASAIESMLNPSPRTNQSVTDGVSPLTLRTLFDTEEGPLLRYAFSLVGRRAVAEDIVQDVFLQLHAHWDDVQTPKTWLYRSVRNRAYNYIRDHRREVLNGAGDSDRPASPAESKSPDAWAQHIETMRALRALLRELDDMDRKLVQLKYFDNLKYRDISAQTGLSVSNVGYRLHHILKKLSRNLRQLGIDEVS